MRNTFTSLFIVVMALLPSAALAQKPLVVVELYTSQGCSSCPPADRLLAELTTRSDVLPLAFHVDYWDYIGWKDSFADPVHAERQRRYARQMGRQMVYTPQMIIGGIDAVSGAKPMRLGELIQAHSALEVPVTLNVQRNGAAVDISASPMATPSERELSVILVSWQPQSTVEILRGENSGQKLTYHNIVNYWQEVTTWDGRAALEHQAQLPDPSLPAAVIIQELGPGSLVAAAWAR